MDDQQIIENINEAITKLFDSDRWLITNDLSEQSISHKLAEYLQKLFYNYNVDCEYNGNIERIENRKKIIVLKQSLNKIGLLRETEQNDITSEFTKRAVFPDIIIHKRGTNNSNLCVIEIKKSTSTVSHDYDYLKLEAYTSGNNNNDLAYQLGIFICIIVDKINPSHRIKIYKDGKFKIV